MTSNNCAVITRRGFVGAMAIVGAWQPAPAATTDASLFAPADGARMWTWWFWLADKVDRASITADLEALKAQGVGGVTVYSIAGPQVDTSNRGPDFMSPAWRELFRHTVDEAERLNMSVHMLHCSGWDAGGPWITPETACKRFTSVEMVLTGPAHFSGPLPRPVSDPRFYQDVAIHAFRIQDGARPAPASAEERKARAALLAYKNCTDSYGLAHKTPLYEICGMPLKPLPADFSGDVLDAASRLDLTAKCNGEGVLEWDVPAGRWVVQRFGCTLTGKKTMWSTASGEGFEADPLDKAGMEANFANIGAVLAKDAGSRAGRVFKTVQIDSWETLLPNWDMKFLDEFQRRRGYDARPYLPALDGRTVVSAEVSDRFLYDYRLTLGDCVAENYFGRLSELAEAAGIVQQSEAGGVCGPKVMSMDALKNLGRCAVPMGEFWQSQSWRASTDQNTNGKQTATAAHVYGKRIASAEAFSSGWQWVDSPANMKPTADRAFAEGLNHFVIFSSATHSGDGTPGTEFSAGTHFNRKITWWKQARPFCDYVARCSHILQQGLFHADVLYYNGDGCPNFVYAKHVNPALGPGYDYDVCNTEVLLTRLSVRDGRIVLPDGMTYRMLVLPERFTMQLEVAQKLKELVEAGLTLVGPKPKETPGLTDYPACDAKLRAVVDTLWGNCDGHAVKEHRLGKGLVAWGITPRQLLTRSGIGPDFEHDGDEASFIDWIHRSDAGREIYFVVNRKNQPERRVCKFRARGRRMRLFDAVTGELREVEYAGGTTLELAPYGSVFVIFDNETPGAAAKPPQFSAVELTGPWNVKFDPKWGGPARAEFAELCDWTSRAEAGIKYYSGKATYEKTFRCDAKAGQRVFLDLGEVREVAEVRVNGKPIGIAWTKPFRLEITAAVKKGENRLEVDIVNLWPNRMIGDADLAPEKRYTQTNIQLYYSKKESKLLPSGLLGPVRVLKA